MYSTRFAKLVLTTPSLEVTTLVAYNRLLDASIREKPLTMRNLMTTKPFDSTYNMYHVVTSISHLESAESRDNPAPSGGDSAPGGGNPGGDYSTMACGPLMTRNLDLSYSVRYDHLFYLITQLLHVCASLNGMSNLTP